MGPHALICTHTLNARSARITRLVISFLFLRTFLCLRKNPFGGLDSARKSFSLFP